MAELESISIDNIDGQPKLTVKLVDGRTVILRTSAFEDAWETFEAIGALIEAPGPTVNALRRLLKLYLSVVNSGDCGKWDPEKEPEVIEARCVLKLARHRDARVTMEILRVTKPGMVDATGNRLGFRKNRGHASVRARKHRG